MTDERITEYMQELREQVDDLKKENELLRKLLNINAYDDRTIDEWLREQG